jgi:capsule polysaccharide export protein KpsE/RkpR
MTSKSNRTALQEEIHLLDYLVVLLKHSRMIVFGTLGVMVLVYLVLVFLVAKKYTATTRILPPQQSMTLSGQLLETLAVGALPGGGAGGAGLGGMAASFLGLKNPGDIYVGMLTGNTIFDRIIERFQLMEVYEKEYIEDGRKELKNNTNIETGKDGLILIEATDVDPPRAAAMANAFAEELDKLLQAIAHRDAKNQLAFLEQERSQTLANLSKAEEDLRRFSEKTGVIQLEDQTRGMIAYIATLRAEIDAKDVQIQVLKKQATTMNFDVVRLETEVNGLRDKLKEAERKADQAYTGDVLLATSKVPGLGLEYIRLFREAKYWDALYQLYCKLVELARLDAARNVAVAQVQYVDRATPPQKKSKPLRLLITALVGLVTLLILIATAFGREYWHRAAEEEENAPRLAQFRLYLNEWREPIRKVVAKFRRKA